jgi:hypothetical protein
MNKLAVKISVALEEARTSKGKIKIGGYKCAAHCYYIEVAKGHINLYIGNDIELTMSDGHYDACVIKVFETYIKFDA